ncbi:hypothetical protein LZI70_03800 [Vibrio pelagius]|uniref:Cytidyltransferase-like domain-containing protein n=1 Tax=Vibrio pelagius TaxID=28169 RepID=A0ABY5G5I4_VIBPE|nr:hypothetical protein [Vibrio pelagius]UTT85414.1 hypothetical protein LZI70_03800 [Vibrio pelagius]
MKIGSIHGRFQPFHNEHMEYALAALELCDYLWIGITQFDVDELSRTETGRSSRLSNPLTYIERVRIITDALKDEKIDLSRIGFVPFPIDQPNKLYQFVEKDTICFTTIREHWNLDKIEKLSTSGYKVEVLWENYKDKKVSSTLIRNSMINGDDNWKNMVRPSTVKHLNSIGLGCRLKAYSEQQ